MYKNKSTYQLNNIWGKKIAEIRLKRIPKTSQRMLAEMLQLEGLDIDKNAVQRIEAGARFVSDIELKIISKVLNISCDELLKSEIWSSCIIEIGI